MEFTVSPLLVTVTEDPEMRFDETAMVGRLETETEGGVNTHRTFSQTGTTTYFPKFWVKVNAMSFTGVAQASVCEKLTSIPSIVGSF